MTFRMLSCLVNTGKSIERLEKDVDALDAEISVLTENGNNPFILANRLNKKRKVLRRLEECKSDFKDLKSFFFYKRGNVYYKNDFFKSLLSDIDNLANSY